MTETRWTKEDADGTYHSVTITEETIAPEGLDEYGKRVTVSQSIMIGALEALARLGLIVGHPTGPLHPNYAEWLMGFPIGWTGLQPLETQSYQQWQQKHGKNLERLNNVKANQQQETAQDSPHRYFEGGDAS